MEPSPFVAVIPLVTTALREVKLFGLDELDPPDPRK